MNDIPKLLTDLPGPKSRKVLSLRQDYVPKGVYETAPVVVKKAKGALIEDLDGNILLDFTSGIAVVNVGHAPDEVVDAISTQAEKLIHSCIHVASYEPYLNLAKKLVEISPGDFPKMAFFLNSGAEAIENAVKVARYFKRKIGIIAFENAFHGRTLLTMSLTSKYRPYKLGFYAYSPGIVRYPYPYPYRCPFKSKSPEECAYATLEFIERGFATYIDPEETAAILFEPVQGEGGYIVPPPEFVKGLREIADKYGLVLINDEVQTGMGRTGKMFAIEHFNTVPDMITLAKSLASGMPISAVVGRKEILDSVHAGGIGGTFGGNPVCAAAALATIDIIEKSLSHAEKIGHEMDKRLKELYDKHEVIGEYRGLGPMKAIELVEDRKSKRPAKDLTNGIVKEALKRGLLLLTAGIYGNVIRIVPPITISLEQLDIGFSILDEAIREASKGV